MSHITTVEVTITDLEAVKALCCEKGWEFREGQKTYEWFGQFMGDSKPPEWMKVEDFGKCEHAVKIPGVDYEIGLVKNPQGQGYRLAFDAWGHGGLPQHIGDKGGKFAQGYGICKTEMEAKRLGLHVRRVQGQAGAVKLVLTGVSL